MKYLFKYKITSTGKEVACRLMIYNLLLQIINGHVVTINETTYMDGDDEFKTLIRVRVIDVKPENETILATEGGAETVTILPVETSTAPDAANGEEERTTPARSIETVEDLDNEIPKNQVDTLTA